MAAPKHLLMDVAEVPLEVVRQDTYSKLQWASDEEPGGVRGPSAMFEQAEEAIAVSSKKNRAHLRDGAVVAYHAEAQAKTVLIDGVVANSVESKVVTVHADRSLVRNGGRARTGV